MALNVTDQEADALLSRSGTVGDDLLDVAIILEAIRTAATPPVETDFSHLVEAAIRESQLTPIERFANEQISITDDWKPRVLPRVAIAALALFALVTMSSGLAYAANGAAPGEFLYGLDRALEVVGIGNGGAAERIAEAQHNASGANSAATEAIAAAAERIAGVPATVETDTAVQDLLDYISDHKTDIDSDMVVDYAARIGRPADPGSSENAPGQVKEDGEPARDVAPGHADDGTPANDNAPGRVGGDDATVSEDGAPGNSENAPGHDENGPGNSENAPGQGNSTSTSTAGTTGTTAPGSSGTAPGQGGENPGQGPSGGGPPGQGGGG